MTDLYESLARQALDYTSEIAPLQQREFIKDPVTDLQRLALNGDLSWSELQARTQRKAVSPGPLTPGASHFHADTEGHASSYDAEENRQSNLKAFASTMALGLEPAHLPSDGHSTDPAPTTSQQPSSETTVPIGATRPTSSTHGKVAPPSPEDPPFHGGLGVQKNDSQTNDSVPQQIAFQPLPAHPFQIRKRYPSKAFFHDAAIADQVSYPQESAAALFKSASGHANYERAHGERPQFQHRYSASQPDRNPPAVAEDKPLQRRAVSPLPAHPLTEPAGTVDSRLTDEQRGPAGSLPVAPATPKRTDAKPFEATRAMEDAPQTPPLPLLDTNINSENLPLNERGEPPVYSATASSTLSYRQLPGPTTSPQHAFASIQIASIEAAPIQQDSTALLDAPMKDSVEALTAQTDIARPQPSPSRVAVSIPSQSSSASSPDTISYLDQTGHHAQTAVAIRARLSNPHDAVTDDSETHMDSPHVRPKFNPQTATSPVLNASRFVSVVEDASVVRQDNSERSAQPRTATRSDLTSHPDSQKERNSAGTESLPDLHSSSEKDAEAPHNPSSKTSLDLSSASSRSEMVQPQDSPAASQKRSDSLIPSRRSMLVETHPPQNAKTRLARPTNSLQKPRVNLDIENSIAQERLQPPGNSQQPRAAAIDLPSIVSAAPLQRGTLIPATFSMEGPQTDDAVFPKERLSAGDLPHATRKPSHAKPEMHEANVPPHQSAVSANNSGTALPSIHAASTDLPEPYSAAASSSISQPPSVTRLRLPARKTGPVNRRHSTNRSRVEAVLSSKAAQQASVAELHKIASPRTPEWRNETHQDASELLSPGMPAASTILSGTPELPTRSSPAVHEPAPSAPLLPPPNILKKGPHPLSFRSPISSANNPLPPASRSANVSINRSVQLADKLSIASANNAELPSSHTNVIQRMSQPTARPAQVPRGEQAPFPVRDMKAAGTSALPTSYPTFNDAVVIHQPVLPPALATRAVSTGALNMIAQSMPIIAPKLEAKDPATTSDDRPLSSSISTSATGRSEKQTYSPLHPSAPELQSPAEVASNAIPSPSLQQPVRSSSSVPPAQPQPDTPPTLASPTRESSSLLQPQRLAAARKDIPVDALLAALYSRDERPSNHRRRTLTDPSPVPSPVRIHIGRIMLEGPPPSPRRPTRPRPSLSLSQYLGGRAGGR
jgi:hypothetical protein